MLPQQPDQQSLGRLGIAAALHDLVENVAVLVNSAPKRKYSHTAWAMIFGGKRLFL